ncbi:MAG: S58 family peptidase [Alphaproteobacteria bacterium]|nr:S58 family peptidase [Alphaproteobacteria bacterium]
MTNPHLATPSGKHRARALGIPFDGQPGANNAITDVPGVEVGYATLIRGDGPLVVGKGPVRTGVTAILPRGHGGLGEPCFAGTFSLNGNGELTGTIWIEEAGRLGTPITITNTHSCGIARDATIAWQVRKDARYVDPFALPVAGETYDGWLNDINGFHVKEDHVFQALDAAQGGPIEEGSVGGGTGMIAYEFKGGSGTASRVVAYEGRRFTVGAFVQANFGVRDQLVIAGVPVGRHLPEGSFRARESGSIIAVIATDAPLLPHQLKRLARRIGLGVGRSGAVSGNSSGDIFLAFSTANLGAAGARLGLPAATFIPEDQIDSLFTAVIRATDEAILNAMVANQTMIGRDGHTVLALPHDRVRELLAKYGR